MTACFDLSTDGDSWLSIHAVKLAAAWEPGYQQSSLQHVAMVRLCTDYRTEKDHTTTGNTIPHMPPGLPSGTPLLVSHPAVAEQRSLFNGQAPRGGDRTISSS